MTTATHGTWATDLVGWAAEGPHRAALLFTE
jgi:hypothetical protein